MICQKEEISIRELEASEGDFIKIYTWLNDKGVYDYYGNAGEKSYDYVQQKYMKKIKEEAMHPCIIEAECKPIGYLQFYPIHRANYDLSEEQFAAACNGRKSAYAIDLFIGEQEYRNKGFGTKILKIVTEAIFSQYDADVILIDPKTNNHRAIACYRKCGFEECFIAAKREEKDGELFDNIIMRKEKPHGAAITELT